MYIIIIWLMESVCFNSKVISVAVYLEIVFVCWYFQQSSTTIIMLVATSCTWNLNNEVMKGDSANAVPHDINYASEFPTFGEIAEVNSTGVQWSSLALGEPPWWSWLTPMPGKYARSYENTEPHQLQLILTDRFFSFYDYKLHFSCFWRK